MDTLLKAIKECSHPDASWVLEGESVYSNFKWLSPEFEKPTEETILAKKAELDNIEPIRLLRINRDKLLSESDKYMIVDFPLNDTQKLAIKNYRQTLRDLPKTATENLKKGIHTDMPEFPL